MLQKLLFLPGIILFFMMLFVPTTYQPAKTVLLALVLGMIAFKVLLKKNLDVHPVILQWTLLMTFTGLFFVLRGFVHGTPGALQVVNVYVLWPLVFTLLLAGTAKEETRRSLLGILVIGIFAIGLICLDDILFAAKLIPQYLHIKVNQEQTVGFYTGYIEYSSKTLNSLLFLVPFATAALMTLPQKTGAVSRLYSWSAFIVGILLVMLSGRRALLIITAFSPFISLVLCCFLPQSDKTATRKQVIYFFIISLSLVTGLIFILVYLSNFSPLAVVEMVKEGFKFQTDPGALTRSQQFFALMRGLALNPLLGAGLGASVPGVIRSVTMPWAYELSYAALLFHTGLLGFLTYSLGIIWIIRQGLRVIRSGGKSGLQMIALLTGMSTFLIANATNPYLEKFDSMWVVFLPLVFINSWLLNHREEILKIPKTSPGQAVEAASPLGALASLDIIIVNWNSGNQLRDCLESMAGAGQQSFQLNRVVVVDNASVDGSADDLEDLDLPLALIANSVNRGFAAACNQGARESNADYLLFLNPDTRLFKNSLSTPLEFMGNQANGHIGILGIQLIDDRKLVSRTCARFPTPDTFISKIFGLNRLLLWLFPNHFMTEWDHRGNSLVDQVIGAYFLVRGSLFKDLNGFDERFFVYFEELDFSLRARRLGWNSYYLADVQAYHKGNGSTEQVKDLQLFYSLRSRILYVFKHFGRWPGTWLLFFTLFLEPLSRLILSVMHLSLQETTAVLKGSFLLWAQIPGLLRAGWQGKSQR